MWWFNLSAARQGSRLEIRFVVFFEGWKYVKHSKFTSLNGSGQIGMVLRCPYKLLSFHENSSHAEFVRNKKYWIQKSNQWSIFIFPLVRLVWRETRCFCCIANVYSLCSSDFSSLLTRSHSDYKLKNTRNVQMSKNVYNLSYLRKPFFFATTTFQSSLKWCTEKRNGISHLLGWLLILFLWNAESKGWAKAALQLNF